MFDAKSNSQIQISGEDIIYFYLIKLLYKKITCLECDLSTNCFIINFIKLISSDKLHFQTTNQDHTSIVEIGVLLTQIGSVHYGSIDKQIFIILLAFIYKYDMNKTHYIVIAV